MIELSNLLTNINNMISSEIKEQSRRDRDYELLKEIHYRLKDGNPELYEFFTLSFSVENNRVFKKQILFDIEELVNFLIDPFTVFYNKTIEGNVRSLGAFLKEFLIILKAWCVNEREDMVSIKDVPETRLDFRKEIDVLDKMKYQFLEFYCSIYFDSVKEL